MTFPGFTVPDGAWIPPELIYLLPNISESELKVTVAVLYHNTQVGGSEPLSLRDIERITGLARHSVINALRSLLERELLERRQEGQSYVYLPKVRTSAKFAPALVQNLDPQSVKLSKSESININSTDSLNLTNGESGAKFGLIRDLRAAGVYLKTAQALVERFDEPTIRQHLEYYRFALKSNLAQSPGWLVESLKEGWGAPLGYQSPIEIPEPEEAPVDDARVLAQRARKQARSDLIEARILQRTQGMDPEEAALVRMRMEAAVEE